MRRLVQWLSQEDTEALTRRQLLARSLLLLTGDDVSLEKAMGPIPQGPIHKPIADFTNMTDPAGDGFTGTLSGVRNVNHSGQTEKHTTMGTNRDLPKGSTSYCAFDWLWRTPAEFTPSGWSLIWQLQMVGSPIAAVSVDQKTLRWFLNSRDGTVAKKYDLGPIAYGKRAYFVVGVHLDDKPKGWVEMWWAHDDFPDVDAYPAVRRTGIQTYQGAVGHDTIGLYAAHGKNDTYTGYWSKFGRAGTASRAVELAA